MDWLADKKETAWDPHAARGYETTGHFFMINRRYEEGIEYYRKAIALDPQLVQRALATGRQPDAPGPQDEEAYSNSRPATTTAFRDAATRNSLKLLESYKKFATFQTDRHHPQARQEGGGASAAVFPIGDGAHHRRLREEVQDQAGCSRCRWRFIPITKISPCARWACPAWARWASPSATPSPWTAPPAARPARFHWASTLWHEMSHVFTLSMTNSHVPRWFTEGIAVHEETAVSPEWGDRLAPDVIMAIKDKKLLPVAELDRGFVHPKSARPGGA